MTRSDIRLALPSKGILQEGAVHLLASCGMKVFRPNPRQYEAQIPALQGLTVMFQRPGDIVVSVRQGSVDFGITGLDVLKERQWQDTDQEKILVLHDALSFGPCTLSLAAPEQSALFSMEALAHRARELANEGRVLRVATKFPNLTGQYLEGHNVRPFELIVVEGTLEIAPAIGYADLIADLVSSGTTLRDNHLRALRDGHILHSQACLIANRRALVERLDVLAIARQLLEYIEAHLRARASFLVIANVRGESAEAIARRIASQPHISGLQGPTIAPVYPPGNHLKEKWFAVNVVVREESLFEAIGELRAIGGSGVVVTPINYIFEQEPARYRAMLLALRDDQAGGEGEEEHGGQVGASVSHSKGQA
jgi:ATP phosphoribosyltransferase